MNDDKSDSKLTLLEKITSLWGNQSETDPIEKLHAILQQTQESELLGDDTVQMIERLLYINETRVRDIMIPRGQMVLIEENAPLETVFQSILESGHSRYPVVDEDHEKVRGILLSKDLLPFLLRQKPIEDLTTLLRPATIVPESKPLDAMLRDFKINRNHMALVIDEYGNLSGLVTIEDVIEEIVGEIDDEHDEIEDSPIKANSDGSYQVSALTPIEQINETLSLTLSDEDADTIGGYIQQQIGRMPVIGDSCEIEGWQIVVSKANQRQLISLYFQKISTSTDVISQN